MKRHKTKKKTGKQTLYIPSKLIWEMITKKKHFIDLKKCTSHMLSWDDTVICTKGALCVRHLGQPLCQGFANLRVNAWLVLAPVELFKWQVSSLGLKCCSGNVGRGLKHHCCNKVIWDLENTAKGTCRVRESHKCWEEWTGLNYPFRIWKFAAQWWGSEVQGSFFNQGSIDRLILAIALTSLEGRVEEPLGWVWGGSSKYG